MPNLVAFIDSSNYYHLDIEHYYKFEKCAILHPSFDLKYSSIVLNNKNAVLYLLTDKDGNHLSILRLEEVLICGKIYHQINKSFSIKPQQGHGQLLYQLVFEYHNINIVSDCINSLPGSYNLWKKLINQGIKLFRYDTKNDKTYEIKIVPMIF